MVIFCRLTENVKHFDQKCQMTLREIVVILQHEPTGSVDGSMVGFADIVPLNAGETLVISKPVGAWYDTAQQALQPPQHLTPLNTDKYLS